MIDEEVKATVAEKSAENKKATVAEKSALWLFFKDPTWTGEKTVVGFYEPKNDEEFKRLAPHADKVDE